MRLVCVDTPELHSDDPDEVRRAYEAKGFVENLCPAGTIIGIDVDDLEREDKYGRTLAVVYVNIDGSWVSLNVELLRMGYAEVLYIPPSEFNPYNWV